jgi:hypothetical protein
LSRERVRGTIGGSRAIERTRRSDVDKKAKTPKKPKQAKTKTAK